MKEPKNKISMSLIDYIKPTTDKNGTKVVYEKTFYENDGLSDFKDGYRFWIFTRQFILKVIKSGKPTLQIIRDCKEVEGKTHKEMIDKLDSLVNECESEVPKNSDRYWLPEDVKELKAAIKSGAFKV